MIDKYRQQGMGQNDILWMLKKINEKLEGESESVQRNFNRNGNINCDMDNNNGCLF